MHFKVKDIGGQMYEIVDVSFDGPDCLVENKDRWVNWKIYIFEGGTQEERAEWGIRKHAKVLQSDVRENFTSLRDREYYDSLEEEYYDHPRIQKISDEMSEAWMDYVAMEDWEYYNG